MAPEIQTPEAEPFNEPPPAPDAAPPARKPPPPARKPRDEGVSGAAQRLSDADDRSIFDWLSNEFAGETNVRIKVYRDEPQKFRGKQVGGTLDEFTELISEDVLRERYGGGKFRIKVFKPGPKGNYLYAGQRTVVIAGDPKLTHDLFDGDGFGGAPQALHAGPEVDTDLAKHAMGMTERAAAAERARAERLEEQLREQAGRSGVDSALLEALTTPLREQIRAQHTEMIALRQELTASRERLTEILNRPHEETQSDKILTKLIDDESGRIKTLRETHEAELRMARQASDEAVKRIEDRFERQIATMERAHEREVSTLNSAHERELKQQEYALNSQIKVLEGQLADVRTSLAEAKQELATLRAQKELPIEEQVGKMASLKEALTVLGGGGEEKEGPGWQQALDTIMSSPLAQGIADRLAGGGAAAQAPAQRPALTAEQRARIQARRQQQAAARTAQPGQPQAESAAAPPPKPIDPGIVAVAIPYIEAALNNDVDPASFALSVRTVVPTSVVDRMRSEGAEGFLKACNVPESSPLYSQNGLNFLRKVAKILGGATE